MAKIRVGCQIYRLRHWHRTSVIIKECQLLFIAIIIDRAHFPYFIYWQTRWLLRVLLSLKSAEPISLLLQKNWTFTTRSHFRFQFVRLMWTTFIVYDFSVDRNTLLEPTNQQKNMKRKKFSSQWLYVCWDELCNIASHTHAYISSNPNDISYTT